MSDSETQAIYDKAQFGQRLRLGTSPAVLVVDFTRGFTDPECPVGADLTAEVEATRTVLDVARARGLLAVFTTIGCAPHLKDVGIWPQKGAGLAAIGLDTPWIEIDPRLGVRDDEPVVMKKGASAFFGTNVASILISQRIDTVVLCGATTSGCIRATAIDLLQYGWPTLVPRECVGDRARAPHEANLFDIDAKYADVVSAEEAIAYLESVPSRLAAPA